MLGCDPANPRAFCKKVEGARCSRRFSNMSVMLPRTHDAREGSSPSGRDAWRRGALAPRARPVSGAWVTGHAPKVLTSAPLETGGSATFFRGGNRESVLRGDFAGLDGDPSVRTASGGEGTRPFAIPQGPRRRRSDVLRPFQRQIDCHRHVLLKQLDQ